MKVAKVMGRLLFLWTRQLLAGLLIFAILSLDMTALFQHGAVSYPVAKAAVGDFSVFRESTGTEVVTSSGFDVTWDTTVTENSNITLAGNDTDIDLADGGKYLVLYNVWTEEGTLTSGVNRRSLESYLTVNGGEIAYGRGAGYIRDGGEGDLEAYNSGGAIIDVSAGADLRVGISRDENNASAGSAIRAGSNGVSVLKLDDSLDYLRVQRSTNVTDISSNVAFTDLAWDTSDEVDTGSFAFSPTSADITLKGGADKMFLVTANVRLQNTLSSGGRRQNYEMTLTLDGTEIPGTRTTTYIRYDNGDIYGTLQYTGIIKKTSAGDQTLNLEVRRESQVGDPTNIIGGETALAMMALPTGAEVLSVTHVGGDQALTSAESPLNFDNQTVSNSNYFSHSTTSNNSRIGISQNANYLFLGTAYADRSGGGGRDIPALEWRLDGSSVYNYGGFGSFIRGSQGGEDALSGGASGGLILNGLTAGQYIELIQSDESTGTPVSNFLANRIAIQAVEIVSLTAEVDVGVSTLNSQPETISPGVTDTIIGPTFVITDNTGSRNITNIILNESGSIDGANDLDNIKIFYDLDETAPYNCEGESYDMGDSQFGFTDTDGFSGADGTANFTASVNIGTTKTFCGYVMMDVSEDAYDGETINISIDNPSTDVIVTSGSVGPASSVGSESSTRVTDVEITQTGYHWRNDGGSESSATSSTEGIENSPGLSFSTTTQQRLRLGVAALGTGTTSIQFRLEYAEKAGTCSASTGWSDVGDVGGAWDMFDSSFLVEGGNTTNIATGTGGVTDEADEFVANNGGVRDVSSQTGSISLGANQPVVAGEVGTSSVPNGSVTTINLENTYTDPIVVASVRYNRSTETQRTPRVVSKTGNSFDILVDNYNGTVTGSTDIDYMVLERGDYLIADGGIGIRVFASSTDTLAVGSRSISAVPTGSPTVTYPTAMSGSPSVVATVATENDADWLFASVFDGTAITSPPNSTTIGLFLNENYDDNGHTATETIDYIVVEQGNGSYLGTDFNFTTSGSANVTDASTGITISPAFSDTPEVALAMSLTTNGADGGYAMVDSGSTINASTVSVAIDEDGEDSTPTVADRGHGSAEEVALFAFSKTGNLYYQNSFASQFTELEFSIKATNSATEGVAYCFRVTDAGTPLRNYINYPEATLSADVTVSSFGNQVATVDYDTTDNYIGGGFAISDNSGSRNVTSVTLTENGTISGDDDIYDIKLFYDVDVSDPYDCSSETYNPGSDSQFGSTDPDGFSGPNGTSTFTDTGVGIGPNATLCLYPVISVSSSTDNGETIDIRISNPSAQVLVDSGTVGPGSTVDIIDSTSVNAPSLTQANYHWRLDDGDETDGVGGASSASDGLENTPIDNVRQGSTKRLRLAVSNDGFLTSTSTSYQLEYGVKVTTCDEVFGWQPIDSGPAFAMATTSQLVDGNDTTNIASSSGGVSNPNTTFLVSNSAQVEDDDTSDPITLTDSEYAELEYAIYVTESAGFETNYCFRVTKQGNSLDTYTNYAEFTIQKRQDFFVQRGTETVAGTSTTIFAGSDYDAPSATSSAFIRITNTSMIGAGDDTLGSTRSPRELFAYILNPENILDSITIARPVGATNDTRVSWEIVEYIGVEGGDNEFLVRSADFVSYGSNDLFATGTSVSVVDDSDVVVFITGQDNPASLTDEYNTGLSISSWNSTFSVPVFERGDADSIAAGASYAVVEFIGANWKVQRAEHVFSLAGVTETENISPINNPSRAFIHAQKLSGDDLFNLDESGHEVWLSSIGAVSFELESGSSNPELQRSVAWVVENTQSGDGALQVYRYNGEILSTTGQPNTYLVDMSPSIVPENASIFANNRSSGPGPAHPRALLGMRILDGDQFEIWKSDEGQNQNFRVEIIEWPVADVSVRQSAYQLFDDNDFLQPTDPWPLGPSDLGESTAMTDLDEPLGLGERVRIRMSIFINNATLVAQSRSFKLQYGRRTDTCSAISSWSDVGNIGSGGLWRGYDGTPVDGTEVSSTTLILANSDLSGTYEEENPSSPNPYSADIGEYIEYDWLVENNGAIQKSSYCFRMVESDGTELVAYDTYPTVRTSGYTPIITNWRWFDDETNETPVSPLEQENVSPTNIGIGDILKLRVATEEIEGASGSAIKFNLQYSQYADFRDGGTILTSTTSCTGGTLWCYADGVPEDNDTIASTTLSGVDSCVLGVGDGCGTHNEAEGFLGVFDHTANTVSEHEFVLQHDGARVNGVYFFRLFDATNGVPVLASSSYPSLVTEGATMSFSVDGINASTSLEGIVTDATTTPTNINFGLLPMEQSVEAAQRLNVSTNGTEGYRVFLSFNQELIDSYGNPVPGVLGTNDIPLSWGVGCEASATGCFGYHPSDNSLSNGSARFGADDTYARVELDPVEVMYSAIPTTNDQESIVYRVEVGFMQPAGDYETSLNYIAVPIF